MNRMKKVMALLLAAVLMLSSVTVSAATSPPSKMNLSSATATASQLTYNGKIQTAKFTVTIDGKTLVEGKDFRIVGNTNKRKTAGTYKVQIKGIGQYSGSMTVSYTIDKADQKISNANLRKSTFSAAALADKSTSVVMNSRGQGKGKRTYSITSAPAGMKGKISVNSNGKITLKKGIKKGTYKITIKCNGDANHKTAYKTITIKVK